MDAGKFGQYIISETPQNPDMPPNRSRDTTVPWQNSLYISEGKSNVPRGAFYMETNIVLHPGTDKSVDNPHSHAFDEYLVFLGTDANDQFDLGGEVELWLGGEKHMITRSCAVFVPGGMVHCPLYIRRVDRPFMFITTGTAAGYTISRPGAK